MQHTLKCSRCKEWRTIKPVYTNGVQRTRERGKGQGVVKVQGEVRCGCGHQFWSSHISAIARVAAAPQVPQEGKDD